MTTSMPFGLHTQTGEIIDVESADRGRSCNCICLSCSQSLIAKKGEKNTWHFAHDKNADKAAIEGCDFNFYSSCRSFARSYFPNKHIERFRTPEYWVHGGEKSSTGHWVRSKVICTQSSLLENIYWESSPTDSIDLVLVVSSTQSDIKYRIGVFLEYPDREAPIYSNKDYSGVLALELDALYFGYLNTTGRKSSMQNMFRALFDSEDDKRWLYHCRQHKAQVELEAELQRMKKQVDDNHLLRHHSGPYINNYIPAHRRTENSPLNDMRSTSGNKSLEQSVKYICYDCDHLWVEKQRKGVSCPKCKSVTQVKKKL